MSFKRYLAGMAAALMVGSCAYAEADTEAVTEAAAQTETVTEAAVSTQAGAGAAATLSDKWSDFQIQIDGEIYQFPMMYEDWKAYGWTEKDPGDELEPNQYQMMYFEKDGVTCMVFVLNLGISNRAAEDCIVAGMELDHFDWESNIGEVLLPGGLVRGTSTLEDIEAAYGQPSDSYEGDLYYDYTYETDYNSSVELYVYKESGVLEDVEVRNFVEPEGFDAGEVNEEVPAEILAYEKPEALGEDLTAFEIELVGQTYTLPVPVQTLLDDGWEINPSDTEEFVKGNSSGWVGLIHEGQSFRTLAYNNASYATLPENCWIEELEIGGYGLELEGALPGGIRTGITEEEFLGILDAAGMAYTVEESGDFKYYTYNEKEYDQCCEATVYTASDGSFQQNTVIEVACRNAFD